jgi:hypothetical protein
MKKNIAFAICILSAGISFAQSKKEVKENKIKSVTVWQADSGDGLRDSSQIYNASGKLKSARKFIFEYF